MKITDAMLVIGILIVSWSFYRAQRRTDFQFNTFDLLMENGKVSKSSAVFMGTFAVTSWVMISLTLDGKMTEGYLGAYGAMWVAPIISRMFSNRQPASPEAQKAETKTTQSIAQVE